MRHLEQVVHTIPLAVAKAAKRASCRKVFLADADRRGLSFSAEEISHLENSILKSADAYQRAGRQRYYVAVRWKGRRMVCAYSMQLECLVGLKSARRLTKRKFTQ
ncbi:hypothetical protein QMT40_003004 [Parvibaculaceae bacterium PLY_AMNH_Bact1]|nr:hypothetical protein QMT40_003004 [Parvibaculaceae bacterium PLY_AMNH_Bact1]